MQNEEDRIVKFRQSLAARSNFLPPSLMKSVYKKPDKNEDGEVPVKNKGDVARKVPVKDKEPVKNKDPLKNKEPVRNKGEKDVAREGTVKNKGPVKNKGDGEKFVIPKRS